MSTNIYRKNPALKSDGTFTDDFKEYMKHHQKQVAERKVQPATVAELMKDYKTAIMLQTQMTKSEKQTIKKMQEKANQLKALQEIQKIMDAIKNQMINQDLDDSVYKRLAIQFRVWQKQKSVVEANELLDKEIREKYGGLKKDLEEKQRIAKREKNRARKLRRKANKAKKKESSAGETKEQSSNKPDEEEKSVEIPVSEEVSIPEVRNRMMFFNTDPRVNPYIFTESKDSIINDIPLNQIVLITAPSGFFHDIPNSQIYDSFDNAFGNILLIQRQSRDRVLIVFNDSETAQTLIRQCNGGCNIRHPFEDREIQFYVMPWGDTLEMERRLMGGRKTRRKKNRKKRTRRK